MKLALFFTEAVSLKVWDEGGMFSREVKPYVRLGEFFDKIYFITYGLEDRKYASILGEKIVILPKKINIPNRIYSFLIPFLYKKELKSCNYFKTNQMLGSWSAVLAKWFFKKKLIIRCGYQLSLSPQNWNMGFLKMAIAHIIESVGYKNADKIILTTADAKEYVVKQYHIDNGKIFVLSNNVDTDLFKPIIVEKKPHSLLFIGRIEKEKNLESLVRALAGLESELDIIGGGSQAGSLKKIAEELKVKVNFLGRISNDNLPVIINNHEVFILPSLYEGNPKVLLEAMACGVPVIGTNVRGINSIIKHGENGFLCEASPESIRQAVIELQNDANLRKILGDYARRYVEEYCSLNKLVNDEINLYE